MKTSMTKEAVLPRKMQWNEKSQEFSIDWKDDHVSKFPVEKLRESCPCALCREEKGNPLRLMKQSLGKYAVLSFEAQGHYAIRIAWADGHSTGIYSYDYLRAMCPCEKCNKKPL